MRKAMVLLLCVVLVGSGISCNRDKGKNANATGGKKPLIGVSFDTLQTEYWVASRDAIKAEVEARGGEMLEAVANNDANRQLEQVNNFIAKNVDGIIIAPKDAQSVVPIIRAANKAGIPIVLYNRPPGDGAGKCVTIVADNLEITKKTVTYMCEQAEASGKKYKALILIGDLADANAIARRDGFEEAVKPYADIIQVVSRVPTEWNQEKALAGLTNALQANPDINFIFTSSDFLFPSIVSALKQANKYKRIGEDGHVLLGGFDGDATAYRMLVDKYLDADGVQDVVFECKESVRAVFEMRAGKELSPVIRDPGFVIHQGNLEEAKKNMWGATTAVKK
jgi:ABC-type sugar transport system substrate-binding protein